MQVVLADGSLPDEPRLYARELSSDVLRAAAALKNPRRRSYLGKRLLLALHLRGQRLLCGRLELSTEPGGRPQLCGCRGECSFSDSGGYMACAYSHSRLGLDIERVRIRPCMEAMLSRYFSASESFYVHASPQPEVSFCLLWTVREAVLKTLGLGLERIQDVRCDPAAGLVQLGGAAMDRLPSPLPYTVRSFCLSCNADTLCLSICGSGDEVRFHAYTASGFVPLEAGSPRLELTASVQTAPLSDSRW